VVEDIFIKFGSLTEIPSDTKYAFRQIQNGDLAEGVCTLSGLVLAPFYDIRTIWRICKRIVGRYDCGRYDKNLRL